APSSFFADATGGISLDRLYGSWYEVGRLVDGSIYARWADVGEFLVSRNGSTIGCRRFHTATEESFQVYLLGQALSFALVQSGSEPLHGTVVVIGGDAVAFLGQSGFGKSTLAASLLASGHQMLTDDLLMLQIKKGRVTAYPGPGRIKLFPNDA